MKKKSIIILIITILLCFLIVFLCINSKKDNSNLETNTETQILSETETQSTTITTTTSTTSTTAKTTTTEYTTVQRTYNSLSNYEKKEICNYIEERYDYYDYISGGYSGDTYSDQIWREAANKYDLTETDISIIWQNSYSY